MAVSAAPYIGELSTNRPPSRAKSPITAFTSAWAAALVTSKVCELPRPTTGSASPEEGIFREMFESFAADARRRSMILPTASPPHWRMARLEGIEAWLIHGGQGCFKAAAGVGHWSNASTEPSVVIVGEWMQRTRSSSPALEAATQRH